MSDRSQPTGGKRKRIATEAASPGATLGDSGPTRTALSGFRSRFEDALAGARR